jgi:protein gp37
MPGDHEAWRIIRATPEFTYLILTKRLERIADCLSAWGLGKGGYPERMARREC